MRFGRGGIICRVRRLLCAEEAAVLLKHNILLRKTEYYLNTGRKLIGNLYRVRLYRYQNKYALHVPLNCCRKGLKIMHVGPVLMNGRVNVGEDCIFHINTALVAGGPNDEVPTLGNGVILGIGAVVVGGVYVADHVAIGANAVVNRSIEEQNIAVAGVPARKVSSSGALEWDRKGKTLRKQRTSKL